jgi:hypothetical protein
MWDWLSYSYGGVSVGGTHIVADRHQCESVAHNPWGHNSSWCSYSDGGIRLHPHFCEWAFHILNLGKLEALESCIKFVLFLLLICIKVEDAYCCSVWCWGSHCNRGLDVSCWYLIISLCIQWCNTMSDSSQWSIHLLHCLPVPVRLFLGM